ncbi:MAG: hypothetical protein KBT02_04920 [Treponema sp.]|nr:hypothetical protein [Candidatus Treponema caballi]
MIHYHLPGLFEFYELYARFLPLFRERRDWFYDWCDIGSIYGAPADCLWGGGRVGFGDADAHDVLALLSEYGISARLTFSNSLLRPEHLTDRRCNKLCALFAGSVLSEAATADKSSDTFKASRAPQNGVIVHSKLLLDYLRETYPELYLVSSTTKVLTRFEDLRTELSRPEFAYVVPDFRLNKSFDSLETLSAREKDKVEFLCNECCPISCTKRALCYENVSRMSLGEKVEDFECYDARFADRSGCRFEGRTYSFSRAMESPAFISVEDIRKLYEPLGFTNFKIEGRSLGSALILEFLLYYLTKPEAQIRVREAIYLDSALDLF